MLPLSIYMTQQTIYENLYKGYCYFLILEKHGLFDSCEPIADYIINTIKDKIKDNKLSKIDNHFIGLRNVFTKDELPELFTDKIKVDIYFDDSFGNLHASTNPSEYSAKPVVIGIYAPYSEELDLSELKAILFHELTHYMVSDEMFNKGYTKDNNFFTQNSIQKPNSNSPLDEQYVVNILYRLNEHEQNAFNSMVRQYLKIYGERDFNKILKRFKQNEWFITLFNLEWLTNTEYYPDVFNDWGIPRFVYLYKKYMNKENNENWNSKKVFNQFKIKIRKALDKFQSNVEKQLTDLLSEDNFNDTFKNQKIDITKYYINEHRNSYQTIYMNVHESYDRFVEKQNIIDKS